MGDIPALTGDEQLTIGTENEQVLELQRRLEQLGHYLGGLDGRYGDTTEEAVRQFQISTGQEVSGTADVETWTLLDEQARAVSADQQTAEENPLSEDGQWQWNGTEWVTTGETAELSEDGQWRWTGTEWIAAADVNTLALTAMHETGRPPPTVMVLPGVVTPAVVALVGFEENPRLEDGGVIAWAIKNIGQTLVPKDTLIGSMEIVDAVDMSVVLFEHQMVRSTAELPPQGVQWVRVPFRFLPEPGQTRFRVIVQAGMAYTDFDFDGADPKTLPTPDPLVFEQWPHLSGGELRWSVRNTGAAAVSVGTSIGEWEIWAGDSIITTLIPKRIVTATSDLPPDGVLAVPPVQLASQRRVDGVYKAVVQLGTDIAEVDYRVVGGQVLP